MTARTRSLFEQILDPVNRANPYPLYTELRKTPVLRESDGAYVISTYNEIVALLHDPRVSSDIHRNDPRVAAESQPSLDAFPPGLPEAFIRRDPPEHDRLRSQAMRPFGPPHRPGLIDALRAWVLDTTNDLLDAFSGREQADVVDGFAFPLPVAAICKLLGVPREDAPRFHAWADELVSTIDPGTGSVAERKALGERVRAEVGNYLAGLADTRLGKPGDDLISGMLADPGPEGCMSREDLLSTSVLLLVAGHETTVNLIANGVLTLLRHPDVLERLRREAALIVPLVEELLRYEPPVQLLPERVTLDDIEIAGTTIPRGSPLVLVLAAGSRDPEQFGEPDRFIADRANNQHLGFGGGVHYCFGAPLARLEAQIALTAFARRVKNPRLVVDPPPYRQNAALRGPLHLPVRIDAILPRDA